MSGWLNKSWRKAKFDKTFFLVVATLTMVGFLIFVSAALGLQARDDFNVSRLLINQVVFGLFGGGFFMYLAYRMKYSHWEKFSPLFFLLSVFITLAVFVPGLGLTHGGATRWLLLGPLTFQPVEILKIATIILAAAWYSHLNKNVSSWKFGFLPTLVLIGVTSFILFLQPDTGSAVVIAVGVVTMFLVAGAKWKQIGAMALIAIVALSALMIYKPYIRERLFTFTNPTEDPLGAGYQVQQSLIAVGSGQLFGRGPGQSIQKFNYLPEPVGDSVFAVFAEEWGFLGSILLITLYSLFGYKGYQIAAASRSRFGCYLVSGLVTVIVTQSFLNIGSMIGVFPLSGMPLIFVSHGGTALLFTLASCGLILGVSKDNPKSRKKYF